MLKYIKTSADAGFGVTQVPTGDETSPLLLLEKRSEDRAGQMDWATKVSRIDPRIRAWLSREKLDFDKYVYALVVPLGADESWEETVNGDSFLRDDLKPEDPEWGHKTFERFARAYLHHRNKNPDIGYGDNPFMTFNDEMDRCEGIWRLDKRKANEVGAGHVIAKLEEGRRPEISMGTHVKYDVCSLCGNKARSVREYCGHPKDPGFGWIDPLSGRKMRVFNPKPRFFDLSAVIVPAAPEALVMGALGQDVVSAILDMEKTSGANPLHWPVVPSSVLGAAYWGLDESRISFSKASGVVELLKLSDLIKRAPALEAEVIRPLQAEEDRLTPEKLSELGVDSVSFPAAISTMAALGIVLTPEEYFDLADPEGDGLVPSDRLIAEAFPYASADLRSLTELAFSPGLARRLGSIVPSRSICYPHLSRRVSRSSLDSAPKKKGVEIQVTLHGVPKAYLYASYIKALVQKMGSVIRRVVGTYPDHETRNLLVEDLTPDPRAGLLVSGEKVSDLPAQALLPAQYLLSRAGRGTDSGELLRAVRSVNTDSPHLFGGVLAR